MVLSYIYELPKPEFLFYMGQSGSIVLPIRTVRKDECDATLEISHEEAVKLHAMLGDAIQSHLND